MKRFVFALVLLSMFALSVIAYSQSFYKEMQHNIIRLHILARSDTPEDQKIKLAVRDEVLRATQDLDINDTSRFIQVAQDTANQYLIKNNIPYSAIAEAGVFHFPKKEYENITLPAGKYRGIRIKLAEGEGQNWWCVMCPPICTSSNEAAMETLKNSLTNDSYEVITEKPRIRFKILDFLNK